MQKRFYFNLTSLLVLTMGYAQAQLSITSSGANTNQAIRLYDPLRTRYSNIEGSPYVPSDTVQQGWLVINNKRTPTKLRYNSQTGEVEYMQDNKVVTPINPVTEFAIMTTDTILFRKGFPAAGTWTANEFYQILYNGRKAKLVKHIRSDIKANTDQMQNDYGKERFRKLEEHYVWIATVKPPTENYFEKLSDGEMKSVVASKKSLASLFPQYASQIDRYLSEQKLKLKSWAEFASVLRFLDTQ
ncbi:hypothetical protein GO755_29980 [Spirosoma sp. HMF4905]|uniref:Uncharacterized protein n=1 Tax=Spirosoma arboris TaxID=2682092 RepID=A0A7K1SKL9_9BACT|nr:hypothetical protein [Spirosoma arboris]MVM34298.1 hypothetical protein [Spirosoma arboris]